MITVLTSTVICLQQTEHRLVAENKNLTPVEAELVSISKRAPCGTPPGIHERIITSVSTCPLGLAVPVDNNIPTRVERKVSLLQHFLDNNARLRTGRPEIVLSK